jgi:hypothetical protein
LITSSGEHPSKASLIADLINSFILQLFYYCYNVIILSFEQIEKFRTHFFQKIFKVRFPTWRIHTVVSLNHVNAIVLHTNHNQYLFSYSHNRYCLLLLQCNYTIN